MRSFTISLTLACLLTSSLAARPVLAQDVEESGISTFTLSTVEMIAAPSGFRAKIEAIGDIGPTNFPLAFTWFVQAGGAVPFNADLYGEEVQPLSTWAMVEGGVALKMPTHQNVFMVHRVRAGSISILNADSDRGEPMQQWSPQFSYCNAGHLFDRRVNWLSINEFAVNPEDKSVFYYYEGFVDAAPLGSAKQIGLGMFWENRDGPQVGPRFRANGFYLHAGVLREPMFFVGIDHVW